MARDWPRLVLAAAIAFAVAEPLRLVSPAVAQSTKTAKKTAKKQADAEPEKDEQGEPKKKKHDPAEAQKAIEAAHKLIESGKAEAAAASLTATLTAGHLPPGMMARALLYRGTANRQVQKPALAIQDLTQALWIKGGLSDTDRAEALRQRSAAYADAGVGEGNAVASSSPSNRIASNDLVTVFLGLELMTLALYMMAGFRRAQLESNEAALESFLLGGFAAAGAFFGIALL